MFNILKSERRTDAKRHPIDSLYMHKACESKIHYLLFEDRGKQSTVKRFEEHCTDARVAGGQIVDKTVKLSRGSHG